MMSKNDETDAGVAIHESSMSPQTLSDLKTHVALLTEAQQSTAKKQMLLSKIVLGDGKPHEGIVWILEENRVALTNISQQLDDIRANQKILLSYDVRIKIVEAHVIAAKETQKTISDTFKKWLVNVLVWGTIAVFGFIIGH